MEPALGAPVRFPNTWNMKEPLPVPDTMPLRLMKEDVVVAVH
jgi:hypothetical protein